MLKTEKEKAQSWMNVSVFGLEDYGINCLICVFNVKKNRLMKFSSLLIVQIKYNVNFMVTDLIPRQTSIALKMFLKNLAVKGLCFRQ